VLYQVNFKVQKVQNYLVSLHLLKEQERAEATSSEDNGNVVGASTTTPVLANTADKACSELNQQDSVPLSKQTNQRDGSIVMMNYERY
jgi:hypothetical protein